MSKQSAVQVGLSVAAAVRAVVAEAPVATSPEALIFAETCAGALVTRAGAAAKATRASGAFAQIAACEDVAERLRAHAQMLHATGVLSADRLEEICTELAALRDALDWLAANLDLRPAPYGASAWS
jgi:hypothetical protein